MMVIIRCVTHLHFLLRFSPGKDWSVNQGLDKALNMLESIKDMYEDVSMADLIILSSTMALDYAMDYSKKLVESFCPGQ